MVVIDLNGSKMTDYDAIIMRYQKRLVNLAQKGYKQVRTDSL